MPKIHGATALVTGADRGIGRHLAAQLVERGAKVCATARRPESVDLGGVEVLALDVADPDAVAAAARVAADVDLLIDNAGIGGGTLLGDRGAVRAALDVNFWGTLSMARAFAPVLAANGGGAMVNIASSAWAAVWSVSNALRQEPAGQGTLVTSVHLGAADTDLVKGYDLPKMDPAEVARRTLDGGEADEAEAVVDEFTETVKASLSKDPREFGKQLEQLLNG